MGGRGFCREEDSSLGSSDPARRTKLFQEGPGSWAPELVQGVLSHNLTEH